MLDLLKNYSSTTQMRKFIVLGAGVMMRDFFLPGLMSLVGEVGILSLAVYLAVVEDDVELPPMSHSLLYFRIERLRLLGLFRGNYKKNPPLSWLPSQICSATALV